MRNYYHNGVEVNNYTSDRHKPRVETTMYVNRDELTLAHLSHLIEKTDNFPENTKVTVHKDRVTVVQESNKPVTSEDLAAATDPRDASPRDELGRLVKRKDTP